METCKVQCVAEKIGVSRLFKDQANVIASSLVADIGEQSDDMEHFC